MSFTWPQYTNEPLDDGRMWSAKFDSYDQRNEDCYYIITMNDGTSFMAAVSAMLSTDKWVEEEARTTLRSRIAQVAATGQPNTTYRGPVMRM